MKLRSTLLKYFLSYFIVFCLLFLGTFFIIRGQITERYFQQLCIQSQGQLDSYAQQLNDDIVYLSQIHTSVSHNIDIISARYPAIEYNSRSVLQELQKYDSASELIDSIIYHVKTTDTLLSTKQTALYRDGVFRLYTHDSYFFSAPYIEFDTGLYYDKDIKNNGPHLISVKDDYASYLIYIPQNGINSRYTIFYLLNTDAIQNTLKNLSSNTMPAVALLDNTNHMVVGVNKDLLEPHLATLDKTNNFIKINKSNSLYVHDGIIKGFSLVSLISNDQLYEQIDAAFSKVYLMLILLGMAGFVLMLIAMQFTYVPLYRFTKKVLPNLNHRTEYIQQLNDAFSESQKNISSLQSKLDNYRLHMQKSLLDSVFSSGKTGILNEAPNIDQFFDNSSQNEIFVLCMRLPDSGLSCEDVQNLLFQLLPNKDSCILLDMENTDITFLLNYTGIRLDKAEALNAYLTQLYETEGILSTLSMGSASPMDIPSLYSAAHAACSQWQQEPVVFCNELSATSTHLTYPHEKLAKLSEDLKASNLISAQNLVEDLFMEIEHAVTSKDAFPDFFTRCILIDMLMSIINVINQSGVHFETYSGLYYETLYLCRSQSYTEVRDKIMINMDKLISFYKQEVLEKTISPQQIRQYIENTYCDPGISIASIADHFHINSSYMSSLIKEKLNINFSSYLWNLRFEKAQDLLKNTDMNIDDISVEVGYLNAKSFRRKFKQETGLTPSEFRNTNCRKITESK